jgi:hypothetical protein
MVDIVNKVDTDAYHEGLVEARSDFTANDFRIKRALDSMFRSAAAIKGDAMISEDLMARIRSLRHLLKEAGHTV